jgi:hypothetical protein
VVWHLKGNTLRGAPKSKRTPLAHAAGGGALNIGYGK